MGLRKGMTNNPAGKPPGAVNKLSRDTRQTITEFLQTSWPEVEKEFYKLSGRDKVNFYKDLLPFVLPRMQAVTMDLELDALSEKELDYIIEKLMTR